MRNTRIYPAECTSKYCGRIECGGCPHLPTLQKFKEWVAAHDAIVSDETWCPTVYVARKEV